MDNLTVNQRRKNMQAIKSKKTKIEELLAKALWAKGYRYRRNNKAVFGKPDFTFRKYKIAIFCDSEFFHGKDWDMKKHDIKSNLIFWHNKIERNMERDKIVTQTLLKNGWEVIRFWGQDIKKNTDFCISKIEDVIEEKIQNNIL